MHAAPTRAPALPVFPLAALPFASVTTSTTEFLFAKKPHWGLGGKVPIWEPRFLYANHQNALGLPVSSYDSGRRSRCTGKERDAETGLDYFGARYFSGAQGRFTSPDSPFNDQHPDDPQSWNLYSYGRNNPLNGIDPDGTVWDWVQATINCFRYVSCHTTAVVADKRKEEFFANYGPNGRPFTPEEKKEFNDRFFKDLSPEGVINLINFAEKQIRNPDDSGTPPNPGPVGPPRAQYENPGHHDPSSPNYVKGKTPLPADDEQVYQTSIKDPNRAPGTGEVYYGKNANGEYYRYSGQNNRVHWSGAVPREQVPPAIRKALQ
jgi:RHS repeat-associated protein